ncbi:DUF6588 family protein [Carboxylicivirga sp. N1Y90]|uniref:DUF6588 family protein n=1 Tax=Carboxylicivirga fragile TaxID=3417571 RepID=UPI003D3481C9|nr:hypothetical protein [Marinilabiliaceae bacterium N1Y90]
MRLLNKPYTTLSIMLLISNLSFAQKNIVDYLNYGVQNAQVLSKTYLHPYAGMIDANLNGGWNSSPSVLRTGRFTLRYVHNQSYSKSADQITDLNSMIESGKLTDISLNNPEVYRAPTAVHRFLTGQELPTLSYLGQDNDVPNGEDISSLQLPMISFAIGIPWGTEINLKLTPPIEYNQLGKTLLWGAGVKHSLVPYFKFLQKYPFLETSLMLTYTQLNANSEVSYEQQKNQSLDVNSSVISGRFMLGFVFHSFNLYGSAGYGSHNTTIDLLGDYTGIVGETSTISDPLKMEYDFSGAEYEAGVQVNLYFLSLQASYHYSNYSAVSLAAGITF